MRDPGTLRKDRDSVFRMFGPSLYRAVFDGEPVYIQGVPVHANWNQCVWTLVHRGDVIEGYVSKGEAESDASLFEVVR